MKYPVGMQTLEQIIGQGYVYVDKTDMVYKLVSEGKIYSLSRPRRFGKSLLLSTLKNYFLGNKEVFKGLKIEALEKDWKTYPVFHLDFNGVDFLSASKLPATLETFVARGELRYGKDPLAQTLGERFSCVLQKAHEQTGLPCVVLVDEYDKPLLDVMDLPDSVERNNVKVSLEDYNREILKSFYSTFKLADSHLQFVFLTGVTKFSQLSVFSGFNQPNDISMVPRYDTLCGITDDEIEHYFHDRIGEIAEFNGVSYDKMRDMLRQRYDGYHFSMRMKGVYNPFSLLNVLTNETLYDYWFKSGTPSYLVRLLQSCNENLDEMAGKSYSQSQFDDYRADSQQPLPMIYQSGYLTVKDYDPDVRTYLLDYPNDEVKEGFVTMIANNYLSQKEDTGGIVRDLIIALKKRDLEAFRVRFDSFLASIPYNVRRKANERERERDFTYTLYLIFRIASCYVSYTEKLQSYGRLDCAIETRDSVFIFEFKMDKPVEEAMAQINEKGYADEFAASGKKIFKIGVAISSDKGRLSGWAVEEA